MLRLIPNNEITVNLCSVLTHVLPLVWSYLKRSRIYTPLLQILKTVMSKSELLPLREPGYIVARFSVGKRCVWPRGEVFFLMPQENEESEWKKQDVGKWWLTGMSYVSRHFFYIIGPIESTDTRPNRQFLVISSQCPTLWW